MVIGCSDNDESQDPPIDDDTVVVTDEDSDTTDNDPTDNDQGMDTGGMIEIGVVHHISRDDAGTNPATSEENIELTMAFLNTNFEAHDIRFVTRDIEFLDNTQWNIQFVKQDDFIEQRVLLPFEDENSLNIFYFNEIGNRENGVITGTLGATALFPSQGNNIKLSSSNFDTDDTDQNATVTHEMGHYFGLYHTDEGFTDSNNNTELVDGSNCEDAGDFICDTAASPELNDSNVNELTCAYIGTETDVNGDLYSPDTFNFMTQWAGSEDDVGPCRRRFSTGQIQKIREVINNERSALLE